MVDQQVVNDEIIAQFRANKGVISEGWFAGRPTVLLHTVGAKSGEPRVIPLYYLDHEGRWFVFGSYGGSPKTPGWVHNLRARPRIKAEVLDQTHEVVAKELSKEESEPVWAVLGAFNPNIVEYQTKTSRAFPVFELVR